MSGIGPTVLVLFGSLLIRRQQWPYAPVTETRDSAPTQLAGDRMSHHSDSVPPCKNCNSEMELAVVIAPRTKQPEVRAFRCKPCDRIATFIVENGHWREW